MLQIFGFSSLTVTRWIFIIRFIMSFHLILNQKIINYFLIFNIRQSHTHIFSRHLLGMLIFTSLHPSLRHFYFSLRLTAPFLFFWYYFFLKKCEVLFFCAIIPNLINCFISIHSNYIFLNNVSILFPELIIFILWNNSHDYLNHILNWTPQLITLNDSFFIHNSFNTTF